MTTAVVILAAALTLAIVVWLVVRVGRDPVVWQRRRLERTVRRAGLRERRLSLGPDTVQLWEGGARDGGRPTVVLVHGFGGDALWQWTGQIRGLADRFRLVVPNLLWFGASRSDEPAHTVAHQVRALLAALDALDARRVDLVGLSYGGVVAWTLAALHPDRVRRLVLVDCPGPDYDRADLAALRERFGVADIADLFVPRTRATVRALVELAYHRPPPTPGFALDAVIREMYTDGADDLRAVLRALLAWVDAPAARPPLPPHETLVVWGRGDPVFPLAQGERLAAAFGDRGRLAVIDAAAHAPNVEHPRVFDRLVAAFLA